MAYSVDILLKEYDKQINIQETIKGNFMKLAVLHNTAIFASVFWYLENYRNKLPNNFFGEEIVILFAILMIMNCVLLSGICYQIYSFFNCAINITKIKNNIEKKIKEKVIFSEENLGRFPDLGVWLSKKSETVPIILWFLLPVTILFLGLFISVIHILTLEFYLSTIIWVLNFIVSFITIVYITGLGLWMLKLNKIKF